MVVDLRILDMETAIDTIYHHFHNRDKKREFIKEKVMVVKNQIEETFKELLHSNSTGS